MFRAGAGFSFAYGSPGGVLKGSERGLRESKGAPKSNGIPVMAQGKKKQQAGRCSLGWSQQADVTSHKEECNDTMNQELQMQQAFLLHNCDFGLCMCERVRASAHPCVRASVQALGCCFWVLLTNGFLRFGDLRSQKDSFLQPTRKNYRALWSPGGLVGGTSRVSFALVSIDRGGPFACPREEAPQLHHKAHDLFLEGSADTINAYCYVQVCQHKAAPVQASIRSCMVR